MKKRAGRSNMSDKLPPYESVSNAPVVFFDRTPAHGTIGGNIEVELAIRALCPNPDGVDVKLLTSARLRCTPVAARHLIGALNAALRLLEETSQEAPPQAIRLHS
jgi:hypothetical protein